MKDLNQLNLLPFSKSLFSWESVHCCINNPILNLVQHCWTWGIRNWLHEVFDEWLFTFSYSRWIYSWNYWRNRRRKHGNFHFKWGLQVYPWKWNFVWLFGRSRSWHLPPSWACDDQPSCVDTVCFGPFTHTTLKCIHSSSSHTKPTTSEVQLSSSTFMCGYCPLWANCSHGFKTCSNNLGALPLMNCQNFSFLDDVRCHILVLESLDYLIPSLGLLGCMQNILGIFRSTQ